jgi:antirestriction protein ArdC
MKQKINTYDVVNDIIITALEQGCVPWQKPWTGTSSDMPKNIVTKNPYQGVNYFMLAVVAYLNKYSSPYWMSFKQAKTRGGYIKKGEKGTPVVWWSMIEIKDKNDLDENGYPKIKKIPKAKHSYVYNLDQTENVRVPKEGQKETIEFNPIEKAEEIISGYTDIPTLKHDRQSAYYNPKEDFINMPQKNTFTSVEEYYSTLFHEMGHSTGHATRLNRKGITEYDFFGSHEYSKEELVAEFTSCYLCGEAGILKSVQDNSVAYIQSWMKKLKEDKKLIIGACSKAKKATEYILGK